MKDKAEMYLMRHGHTVLDLEHRSDGWLDLPLSDNGQLSVIPAQQELKDVPLRKIFTPDLKRTQETACIMESGILSDPKVIVVPEARTWNLGVIAGTQKRYGRPEVQKLIDNPDRAPEGGESYNNFRDRFLPWLDKQLAKASPSAPVLFVGSGSNLRLIGQALLGDIDALDLDEGGLAYLYSVNDGQWKHEIVLGEDDLQTEIS